MTWGSDNSENSQIPETPENTQVLETENSQVPGNTLPSTTETTAAKKKTWTTNKKTREKRMGR